MFSVEKSLCFQVDIDVVKPLIQGVRILVDKNPFGLRLGMSNYKISVMAAANWIMFVLGVTSTIPSVTKESYNMGSGSGPLL